MDLEQIYRCEETKTSNQTAALQRKTCNLAYIQTSARLKVWPHYIRIWTRAKLQAILLSNANLTVYTPTKLA